MAKPTKPTNETNTLKTALGRAWQRVYNSDTFFWGAGLSLALLFGVADRAVSDLFSDHNATEKPPTTKMAKPTNTPSLTQNNIYNPQTILDQIISAHPDLEEYRHKITPDIIDGLSRAARTQNYPLDLLFLTVKKESSFNRGAKNGAQKDVFGLFQLKEDSFLEQIYKNRDGFAQTGEKGAYLAKSITRTLDENKNFFYSIKKGYDKAFILAARDDPHIGALASIFLSRDHMKIVQKRVPALHGKEHLTYTDAYVIHLLGCGNAATFYNALYNNKKNKTVAGVLPSGVIARNSGIFCDKNNNALAPQAVYNRLTSTFGTKPIAINPPAATTRLAALGSPPTPQPPL